MRSLFFLLLCLMSTALVESQTQLSPVDFSQVQIDDLFWNPRLDKISSATLPACIDQTEVQTGRIRNFEKAAAGKGNHEGIYYDDSDVYKALEAIAYSLRHLPDAALEAKADDWIVKIAAAQQSDGYLNTYYTLNGLDQRWQDMEKHEAYCAGHLIEAGVAYFHATGKRQLLEVSQKMADHIDNTFRLAGKNWVAGHQEIELALVKLYRVTQDKKYLELANWFLEQRGHGHGKGKIWDDWKDPGYCQDAVPVKEAKEITGHAVRAMYMYTGAADIASLMGDDGYMNAMQAIWQDVVFRNMYITGGIGSSGSNEGFSVDYDLPNEQAYCETCASVGMVFWNKRMNLLTGDAKFIDVLERSLYNGALDGLSLSGDRFFYGNPLASSGQHSRRAWYGTACCPSNIARLVASVGDYIYAFSDDAVYVNLFISSSTETPLNDGKVKINLKGNYPWSGDLQLKIDPEKSHEFTLKIRLPGWLGDEATPGGLYRFERSEPSLAVIAVNGTIVDCETKEGYALIHRVWSKNDEVSIRFPMPVRQIIARSEVRQNQDRVAIQRGPLVYAFEGIDNGGGVFDSYIPEDAIFDTRYEKDLLGGVNLIQTTGKSIRGNDKGDGLQGTDKLLTAIPYYTWNNRGVGEMQVWMPRRIGALRIESAR
ncbi:MAG: glycoside hydrolase family 127 protein [Saprospiraceae bacterium]|nr:glycoside hydrolase family 127 protein [Saprospiraceae bacterium]